MSRFGITEKGELSWERGAQLINDCAYVFMSRLELIDDFTLRVSLVEGKAQAPLSGSSVSGVFKHLLAGAMPVTSDGTCRSFRLEFDRDHLVMYNVLNESYSKAPSRTDSSTGGKLRRFSRSQYLDFATSATIADDDYPGPLIHFQIVCENHVVDAIATAPPKIIVVGPTTEM